MAIYFYDLNNATAGFQTPSTSSLTGNWNAALQNWTTASAGDIATVAWPAGSATTTTAYFGSASVSVIGGTVTVPTGVNIQLNGLGLTNCTGDHTVLSAGSGGLQFVGTGASIDVAAGPALRLGVTVNGTVDITKSGAGELFLFGSNTLSGAVFTHTSGTLRIGSNSALGLDTLAINSTSAALDVTASSAFTITNPMIITSGFRFVGTSSLTQGTGNIGLNGATNITIDAATLTLGGLVANYLSTTGSITAVSSSTGALALTNSLSTFSGGVSTGSARVIVGASSVGSVGAVTSGPLGTGTLTLTNGTIDSSGTYTIDNVLTISGAITMGLAASTGSLTLRAPLSLGATRVVSVGGSSTLALTGNITGATFGINKQGTGTLTLSGVNSAMTGPVTLTAGTLNVNSTTAIGSIASTFTISGGTLDNTTAATIILTANQPVTVGNNFTWKGTRSLILGGGSVTLAAVRTVSGDGTIAFPLTPGPVAAGAGGWTVQGAYISLTNANLNTGKSIIGDGVNPSRINIQNGNGLGASPATFVADQLTINAVGYFTATAALSTPTNMGITISGATNFGTVGGAVTMTVNGIIAGTGSVTLPALYNTGTTVFAGANTFSGSITIESGTLSATTSASALGADTARSLIIAASPITPFVGGALSLGIATTRSLFNTSIAGTGVSSSGAIVIANTGVNNLGPITLTNAALIRATSAGTLANTITNAGYALTLAGSAALTASGAIGGSGSLTTGIAGSTSTITLSGASNYTGNTVVAFSQLFITGSIGTTVSGVTTYTGTISIASGLLFNYGSSTSVTLSGVVSGAGGILKSGGSIVTLSNSNTYTGTTTISLGTISANSISSVATPGASALGAPTTVPNGTINFGSTSSTGILIYTGSSATTDRVVNLAGNTTGGATITNNGTGALVFTSAITGVASGSSRTLTLQGSNAGVNDFQGAISNVSSSVVIVGIGFGSTPVQNGYWKLSGANTHSGGTTVNSGIGEIAAASALGTGTVTVNSGTRNASLRVPGGITVTNTLVAGASVWGGDTDNSPLGAIRTVSADTTTFSGTYTPGATNSVYADQGDLAFTNTITAPATFVTRAALGRTVTLSGGLVSTAILFPMGPGTTIWKGTNTTTAFGSIYGGTLSVVLDGTATFANTSFGLGALGTVNLPGQRYAFTGGTLEFDNVGATGSVSKTFSGTTTVTRGPATFRLKRTAAQTISVTLSTLTAGTALATIEYAGTVGTVGTDSIFQASNISGAAAANTVASGFIISNGSALVPAAWTASPTYITFPVYGTTTNFTTQGASAAGLTVATGTTQNTNVTGAITGQNTVAIRTIRLNDLTASVALNSGQRLDTNLFMSMGTGTSATLITGGTLGSSGNAGTLHIYAANASGSTIASALDKRNAPLYGINGSGTLTFSGAVRFATTLQHNAANVAFSSTFALPFGTFTQANPSESADAITMTLGSGAASLSILQGGGANTTLALNGGDLTLTNMTAATSYYAGAITRNSTQKLIVKMLTSGSQSLHGALSVPLEFKRGQITIAPIYGATVTGAITVTFSGTSALSVDMSGNTLNSNYSTTFGAMAANAGYASVTLSTSGNGTYTNTLTFASLAQSGAGVVNFSATSNSQNLTVFTTPPTPTNNIVGPWAYNATLNSFVTYRTTGTFVSNGSAVPDSGSIDSLIYGTDTNTTLITTGTAVSNDATKNVSVTTTGITAQTTASAYTLRLATTMAISVSQAFKTNAVLSTSSGNIISGANSTATLSTISGDLYLYGATSNHSIKVTDNGITPTRVVLFNASLTSTASDYTGGTVVYGTLAATTTDAMLGDTSGGLTFDGAAFSPSANFTTSRSISIPNAGLVLSPATGITAALNGALSGDGILRFTGLGTTTISGLNTLSGFINIAAGTVSISHNAALGTTSEIDMGSGTLVFASGVTSFDSSRFSARNAGTYFINNGSGSAITFSSSFGNFSAFNKTGTSDIVLGAANGITSTVTVTAGALVATDAGALGYGDVAATTTVSAGTSLVLRGTFTLPALSTSAATRTYAPNGTGYSAGGYEGSLWADSGVVTVPGDITPVTNTTIGTGATGGLILTGAVSLGISKTFTTRVDGSGNIKMTGVISGTSTSGITKTGTNRLELAPATSSNTYTGPTTLSVGTLLLTSESPTTILPVPAASSVTLAAGTTLQTSTGTIQKGRVTLASLTNSAGGTIRIGG